MEAPPVAPPPRKSRGYCWALAALTVLSGFLCFHHLGFPSPQIDECFTYWRTCGNLDQLLDTLQNDAFVPLHYEVVNWIGQGFPLGFGIHLVPGGMELTPAALRFFSALCGMAMTPVVYLLARQMFSRGTALMAAAMMSCSAYGLYFSHNAKMYAPAWMFSALSLACFLWWLRTWTRLAWLCWMAAGIAAAGTHAITLLLLPLAPLYFISMGRFGGWRVPMLLLGLAMISAGPGVYYGVFNRWTQNSGGIAPGVVGEPNPDAQWEASGLNWIPPAEDSLRQPMEALNAFVSGYQWSAWEDLTNPPELLKKFSAAMMALAVATYAVFVLGALPWRHGRKYREANAANQPWWRGLLWLGLWLVLPTYAFFYCRSVEPFSTPVDWAEMLWGVEGWLWLAVIGAAAVFVIGFNRWPKMAVVLAVPLLLLALAAAVEAGRNHFSWETYIAFPANKIALLTIVPALLFHFSGDNLRARAGQALKLLAVIGGILLLCEGGAIAWRRVHEISMRKHPELPWQSLWVIRYVAIVLPVVWVGAAALIGRLPTLPVRVGAVVMICSYNAALALTRQYVPTQPPLERAMADMYSAQPGGSVRTYFGLKAVTDNLFYRPLTAYSACVAAGLRPTPAEFRNGKTWPYEWGRVADEFRNACDYRPIVETPTIRADIADGKVTKVIVWEVETAGASLYHFVVNDSAASALGSGWTLASDEHIKTYYDWMWQSGYTLRRREFRRGR